MRRALVVGAGSSWGIVARQEGSLASFTRLRHSRYGVMLLCSSSRGRKIVRAVPTGGGGVELVVDLAGEVALEAAQDLLGGLAFGEPTKAYMPVSYTHLRAHETVLELVCRL